MAVVHRAGLQPSRSRPFPLVPARTLQDGPGPLRTRSQAAHEHPKLSMTRPITILTLPSAPARLAAIEYYTQSWKPSARRSSIPPRGISAEGTCQGCSTGGTCMPHQSTPGGPLLFLAWSAVCGPASRLEAGGWRRRVEFWMPYCMHPGARLPSGAGNKDI
ncbi:hypothetical protein L227DRAFT_318080 [Lentinus tigrinus ALCF2SS1-6]|uniref:Uncharacterized protein n=1 Tax=Lentinus tigrinus ALCF2SS1-6 TaxID=1328759 RepID=A0A5C2SJR4_9APHY|nr:hypothetical protein L227DRAFT_318080 [Lentinus tigrinus ALCF2SS1-6]